jgi:hypothetical protein
MADEENTGQVEDLTGLLQSGTLSNPSETATYKAEDVKQGNLTLTIQGFKKRKFVDKTGKEEVAWVVVFAEGGPALKLNLTRQEQLHAIMGTNQIDAMIGRPITLTYDPDVKFGAKKVGGIALERAEPNLV